MTIEWGSEFSYDSNDRLLKAVKGLFWEVGNRMNSNRENQIVQHFYMSVLSFSWARIHSWNQHTCWNMFPYQIGTSIET